MQYCKHIYHNSVPLITVPLCSSFYLQTSSIDRRPSCVHSESSNFMANLSIRSRYVGEVSNLSLKQKWSRKTQQCFVTSFLKCPFNMHNVTTCHYHLREVQFVEFVFIISLLDCNILPFLLLHSLLPVRITLYSTWKQVIITGKAKVL